MHQVSLIYKKNRCFYSIFLELAVLALHLIRILNNILTINGGI